MTTTISDSHLLIEDIVSALTGNGRHGEPGDLREQMERAAAEFDKRTADAFGKALLDSLCDDPGNLRQLEALLILGLAHPDVLKRHRISLAVEGRRLAVLLERAGEMERARSLLELLSKSLPEERTVDHELAGLLRRSGNTDELIDRYLSRADECVEAGKVSDAIPWLQEILLLDRTRRDVARMIRDLRYQEAERQVRSGRRNRLVLISLFVSTVVTIFVGREVKIHRDVGAVVAWNEDDPQTLYARHGALQALIDDHVIWTGAIGVSREVKQLASEIEAHEARSARDAQEEAAKAGRLQEMAESARLRGLMHFEQSNYEKALQDFKRALSMCTDDWEHRARLEADIAALEKWKASR